MEAESVAIRVDQFTLRARVHPVPDPIAHVLLVQGRTEFLEKYEEVIDRLGALGISVAAFDWRGQGLSGPETYPYANADGSKRGHVGDFSEYDRDLDAALDWFEDSLAISGRIPRVLLGHSMGAMIGMRGLIRHPKRFDAAFFTAPMWGLPISSFQTVLFAVVKLGKGLFNATGDFLPSRGNYSPSDDRFQGNALTRDPVRYARYANLVTKNPKLGAGGPTVAWTAAAFDAIDALPDLILSNPPQIPIRVLSCPKDRIVDSKRDQSIVDLMPQADLVLLSESGHEPLMERDDILDSALDHFKALIEKL